MRKPSRMSRNFGCGAIHRVRDTDGGTDLGTEDMFNFGQVESEKCGSQTSMSVQKPRWSLGRWGALWTGFSQGLLGWEVPCMLHIVICVYRSVSLY